MVQAAPSVQMEAAICTHLTSSGFRLDLALAKTATLYNLTNIPCLRAWQNPRLGFRLATLALVLLLDDHESAYDSF